MPAFNHCLVFFILSLSLQAAGTLDFERFKIVHYSKALKWTKSHYRDQGLIFHTCTISNYFRDSSDLQLTLLSDTSERGFGGFLQVKKKNIVLAKLRIEVEVLPANLDSIYVEDFNGDRLQDVKFCIGYMSCGLGALNYKQFFLLQHQNGAISVVSFLNSALRTAIVRDKEFPVMFPEHLASNDSTPVIVVASWDHFKKHSYWFFNLYQFDGFQLRNVDTLFGYPHIFPFLYSSRMYPLENPKRALRHLAYRYLPQDYARSYIGSRPPPHLHRLSGIKRRK